MTDDDSEEVEGGESACFAHLICPECGAVLDGTEHVESCPCVDLESAPDPRDRVDPGP